MKTAGLLLALVAAAPQEPVQEPAATADVAVPVARTTGPQVQARMIFPGKGSLARGVTLYVPRDAKGNRYYYSRATSGSLASFSETTIESWSDAQGRPLRAKYRLESKSMSLKVDLTVKKDKVILDEWVVKNGSKPATAQLSIPLSPDTTLQLSQFHPMDVALDDAGTAEFIIVDPIAKTSKRARLVRSVDDAEEIAPNVAKKVMRYRIETGATWSEIVLEEDGRFREMKDSLGTWMTAAEITPAERGDLRRLYAQATGQD